MIQAAKEQILVLEGSNISVQVHGDLETVHEWTTVKPGRMLILKGQGRWILRYMCVIDVIQMT